MTMAPVRRHSRKEAGIFVERHSCRTCRNLEQGRKEGMEGRLKGRYRYGCSSQGSGYVCGFLAGDEDLETLFCNLWHGQSERKPEKQKGKQRLETELGETLQELFDRWNEWYLRGCPEDRETDGVYLNRLRLAIKGLVERIEETLEETQYPECYYSPLPPETAEDYMADTDSLVKSAERALYQYMNSPDYLWLETFVKEQSVKGKSDQKAAVFLDHVKALEEAIGRNQFLRMKQELRQEGLLAELAKYRRTVSEKGNKASGRNSRKGKKGISGQFTLFGEKAS